MVIIQGEYLLKKFPGKGGWTYTEIPEIHQNPNNPFGWVTISGSVDDYELHRHKLMPMGNGQLFLSLNKQIRKKIKKEAGDTIHLNIRVDEAPKETPKELLECFQNEPDVIYQKYLDLLPEAQHKVISWIHASKTEDEKVERIAETMKRISEDYSW